jgi:hypothetical protein
VRTSSKAWMALGVGVAAYDYLAPQGETMSEWVDSALERHPITTTLAVGAVALHLLNVLPPQIDLIHQIARVARHD